MEKQTLSDKINKLEIEVQMIRVSDVKDFIKKLKEIMANYKGNLRYEFSEIIDKIFGDKLVEQKA